MSDCHLVSSNTRLDGMFAIQEWVIQFVCMLLMPCKLSYNAAQFLSSSQLALPWDHLKQMIQVSNLLKFFLSHLAPTDQLD